MRAFASILLLLTLILTPLRADATTLQSSLQKIFAEDDAGLRLLRENGAQLGDLLTLERVPTGSYVIEVAIRIGDRTARYPLKLGRATGDWALEWQPEGVYAGALLGMAKSGALPPTATGTAWSDVSRLPALPIIGTRKRYVTPFGEVALNDHGDGPAQGDLEISPGLVQAVQSWVNRVLDEDPAPAGFDLILDREMSWKAANKALFNAAVAGLYQVTIVTSATTFEVARVASPVARPATLVVALYALESGFGIRVSRGKEVVAGDGCAPEMTSCFADEAGFAAATDALGAAQGVPMFAAAGDVTVGDAVRFLVTFGSGLGVPPHRLLMGYVQK